MSGTDAERLGAGRLITGLVWVLLLLGLWSWGSGPTEVRQSPSGPATGDMAAAGRPAGNPLPPAATPLRDAVPRRLDIPDLGVRAPVVSLALDARGALEVPPAAGSGAVGWYAAGVKPGAPGTALLVGRADGGSGTAVFRDLGALRPGSTIRVGRGDGTVADFTVEDVATRPRDRAASGVRGVVDASEAPAPRASGVPEVPWVPGVSKVPAAPGIAGAAAAPGVVTGVTGIPDVPNGPGVSGAANVRPAGHTGPADRARRAGLRLVAEGGAESVVVSAYLTGTGA
ncbi:sortase domain-bontaining protein [Streptomyces sp. NPDC004065]|uniref:sortase domain-containing protein n=1 Tax=Streptomyces sp. NPDC004065 TaxID=3364689 RepID=UPI00384AE780